MQFHLRSIGILSLLVASIFLVGTGTAGAETARLRSTPSVPRG
jgi:hypothetical protein